MAIRQSERHKGTFRLVSDIISTTVPPANPFSMWSPSAIKSWLDDHIPKSGHYRLSRLKEPYADRQALLHFTYECVGEPYEHNK